MEVHNTTEDLVIAEVNSICDALESEGKNNTICTCSQCRLDAICYVLNRIPPHYVVSHRGLSRVNQDGDQQSRADLTAMVYEGIRRVSHNQRPYFDHARPAEDSVLPDTPVFNLPTIMGRIFNGLNFSPMADITVELLQNGNRVPMKNNNWQNPFCLLANTNGTFTFWPKPAAAESADTRGIFEYTIRVSAPDFAELNHVFAIPAVSEIGGSSLSLARTFKLPDLYVFPPGEEKNQLIIAE